MVGTYRTCRVFECPNLVLAKNYCRRHYEMWKKHGSPTPQRKCHNPFCDKEFLTQTGIKGGNAWKYCEVCRVIAKRVSTAVGNHGITPFEYLKILGAQDNHCKLCQSTDKLCIDHDHSHCSGEKGCRECIRGILCFSCNLKVGWYELISSDIKKYEAYTQKFELVLG